jgi:hypothetical protein
LDLTQYLPTEFLGGDQFGNSFQHLAAVAYMAR